MDYAKQWPEYDAEMRALGWVTHREVAEAGWWWWYNDDGPPVPVYLGEARSVLFVAQGQHGWNRAQRIGELGGWWLKHVPETATPPFSVDF